MKKKETFNTGETIYLESDSGIVDRESKNKKPNDEPGSTSDETRTTKNREVKK